MDHKHMLAPFKLQLLQSSSKTNTGSWMAAHLVGYGGHVDVLLRHKQVV
jgi:hypothetical protein